MFSTVLLVYSLLVFVVSAALCIWLGCRRGVFNSAMRLGFFLFSGIVAFVIARLLVNPIGNALSGLFASMMGEEASMLTEIESVQQLLVKLAGGLLAPIVFMLLFFVIDKLTFFAYIPLKKKFADNEKLHTIPHDKLFGGILGFVLAFCITLTCVMPVGYVGLIAETVDTITATSLGKELPDELTESVSGAANRSVFKVDYALSGWLLRGLTSDARSTVSTVTSLLDLVDTLQNAEDVSTVTAALQALPPKSVGLLLSVAQDALAQLMPEDAAPIANTLSAVLKSVPQKLEKLPTEQYNNEIEAIATVTTALSNPSAVEEDAILEVILSSEVLRASIIENSDALTEALDDAMAELTKKEKQELKTTINEYADEFDIPDSDVSVILSIFGIK